MKHLPHFDEFLRDVVNLNQARINTLEQRVGTIENFVLESGYQSQIMRFNPQGSWAHKTIIKPPRDRDFDADLLMIVRQEPDWAPGHYIDALFATFQGSDRYKKLVSRKTRCVRINYTGDFHIDLIPIIEEIGHNGARYFNCNRRDDQFEQTAPEAYTQWWGGMNALSGGNQLILVTRLLKYLRDIKGTFSCKSILLTTLVGYQVWANDHLFRSQNFPDLPTSLRTIVSRLDDVLQKHPVVPRVENPVLSDEDYNRHWNQEKYENFRDCIHRYREWIDDAYNEVEEDESILKWRRVFGDEFARSVEVKSTTPQLARLFTFADQWLAAVRQLGRQALQEFPKNFDHVKRARWLVEKNLSVAILAGVASVKNGGIEYQMQSGDVIPAGRWIRFQASMASGVPNTFKVEWRVVNTGGHAVHCRGRRGGFYKSNPHGVRWEETQYRGVHWVEAFVINKRTNKRVGKSDRFFVLIE